MSHFSFIRCDIFRGAGAFWLWHSNGWAAVPGRDFCSRDVPRSILKDSRDVPRSWKKASRDVPRINFKDSRDMTFALRKNKEGLLWGGGRVIRTN